MKKRPLSIYILVSFHLMAPLFTVLFSRFVKNQSLAIDTLFTATDFTMNWPGYLLPVMAAAFIYACKKWSMVAYLITMTALFVISFVNYTSEAQHGSVILLALVWLINIAVVVYFLRPALRQIYTDPKIRWWEQSQRFKSAFTASFKNNDFLGDGQITNISKTGLLLKTEQNLKNDERIDIKMQLNNKEFLQLSGRIIIHEKINSAFGVKFDNTTENKRNSKQIIKNLKSL